MKTHYKIIVLASALALGTGGSLVLAQAPAAPTIAPTTTVVSTPGATGARRGGEGRGPRGGQPRMELALALLRDARNHLENAVPDKGGFREKAIASVDRAMHDVQDGIDYARDHPEEFRGARGRGEGPRGTVTSTVTPPAGG